MSDKQILIKSKNLKKYFNLGHGQILKAVDDVTLEIAKGETLGLVGESGCGKSTLGRTIIRLYDATDGVVEFDGKDIHKMNKNELFKFTGKAQMIFQDPYASLNPRMTVGGIIGEGIDIHGLYTGEKRTNRIYELLELVGLNKEHANRFPHEFSGGQRQRIGIARALAIEPEFIVCDEPISALDVSIQAQIVNLLRKLQKKLNLTYLFIAHDLNMVKYISDRVAVMYLGTVAEISESKKIYDEPLHPYTQALLSAIPIPDPSVERAKKRIILDGDVPSPINAPKGCTFCTRCPKAMDQCSGIRPELKEVKPGHFVACHLYNK
jgi:oligopeptide transport system ATP-binding protein